MIGVLSYSGNVHVRTTTSQGGATVLTETGVSVAGSSGAQKQQVN